MLYLKKTYTYAQKEDMILYLLECKRRFFP